ncbi:hypothetical protein [Paenibacillus sp. RC67]|uniref:hypothetical protein n=1 Tax=Paenibacillus sp. RC67 TaxID=3039392 RepID=UPI0024AD60A1|nr:hypothetical protein [Paenibacillus sp. RC67]
MDTIVIVSTVLITQFLLGLFIKNYLPSYMNEKGKNLATKEDIQEITDKVESTKFVYNSQLETFKTDLIKDLEVFKDYQKFKREYSYSQFKELYVHLYGIIVQSEYLRYFFQIEKNVPFIELHIRNKSQVYNIQAMSVEDKEEAISNLITEFNKIQIVYKIIDSSMYASQSLLKKAVSYRFVSEFYTDSTIEKELLDKYKDEELKLISEIVQLIVKETNELRKICEMDYNDEELKTGILQLN